MLLVLKFSLSCLLQNIFSFFLSFWSEMWHSWSSFWTNSELIFKLLSFLSSPAFNLIQPLDAENLTSPAAPPTTSYKRALACHERALKQAENDDKSERVYICSSNVYIKWGKCSDTTTLTRTKMCHTSI